MPAPVKPTQLKILNGSAKLHPSRVNPNEPQPELIATDKVTVPEYVTDPDEREVYVDLAHKMTQVRVLSVNDERALAQLAAYWVLWKKLNTQLTLDVKCYESGYEVMDPRISTMIKIGDRVTKLFTEFGLTPSSRSRVNAMPSPSGSKDPVEEFFKNAK